MLIRALRISTFSATLSDNDSVTSLAIPKSSSSTSSDSGLSDSLQGSKSYIDVTNTPPGPPSDDAQSIPTIPSEKAPVDLATNSQNVGVKPSASKAIARLRSFVSSRMPPSDSDQTQVHNDKLGPEAVKVKRLLTRIRTYAMDSDLSQSLHDEPTLGSDLLDEISLLKTLQTFEYAKLMVTTFEGILVPLVQHVNKVREVEQLVESKEIFMKEHLEVIVQATGEILDALATIEKNKQELEGYDKRAAEIHAQISALNQELEVISTRKAEITSIFAPAQSQADQMAANAIAVSEAILIAESELEALKLHAETFTKEAIQLKCDLQGFQNRFRSF